MADPRPKKKKPTKIKPCISSSTCFQQW